MAAWCPKWPRAPMSATWPALSPARLPRRAWGRRTSTAVAATAGPGLAGALHVGLSFAKAYAHALGVPFAAANHLEGHLASAYFAETPPAGPFLALVVSGGHTLLVDRCARHAPAPARTHARRCGGRGVRQGRQAARARLSRRPRHRPARRRGRSRVCRLSAHAPRRLRLLVQRHQNGGALLARRPARPRGDARGAPAGRVRELSGRRGGHARRTPRPRARRHRAAPCGGRGRRVGQPRAAGRRGRCWPRATAPP